MQALLSKHHPLERGYREFPKPGENKKTVCKGPRTSCPFDRGSSARTAMLSCSTRAAGSLILLVVTPLRQEEEQQQQHQRGRRQQGG